MASSSGGGKKDSFVYILYALSLTLSSPPLGELMSGINTVFGYRDGWMGALHRQRVRRTGGSNNMMKIQSVCVGGALQLVNY